MNGKQLFCLSLIFLSIAMGMHWQKNRPKVKPKKPTQNRVALNIDDLQIQDDIKDPSAQEPLAPDGTDVMAPDTPLDPDLIASATNIGTTTGDIASISGEIASGSASAPVELDPLMADPIIASMRAMARNPFERSPYAKLVEEIRAREGIKDEVVEKKNVKLLTANFSATIGTKKELVAVIDSKLYRKGELFQDKKITEIKNELVSLENGADLFLIPKFGVNVKIAEDGTYSVEDNFHKN